MILSAHQPSYWPWLGQIAKVASADLFCLFDVVPMESSGFENRNRVLTQQGVRWLTVPVRRGRTADGPGRPLSAVEVCGEARWARKHWRTIELAYRKAPYFEQYEDALRRFYEWAARCCADGRASTPGKFLLVDLCEASLRWLMEEFAVATPVVRASAHDLAGKKSGLVLDLCLKLGATEYIFGERGRDYADVAAFERAGVRVRFQEFNHPTYRQVNSGGAFASHLSALDCLLNVGRDGARALLRESLRKEAARGRPEWREAKRGG